jgi:cytochrome bd ubiquinol oxidase subunit II
MSIADAPAVVILVGLAAYVCLAGADFGAGFWQLWPGRSSGMRGMREHAHRAMGPVWEANHVWLIFVLVVCWTAYPVAFGSIASSLAIPLFVAAIGIILRGTTYALRPATATLRGQRRVEVVFSLSSILTPFALGAVVGSIASGRVPVGNARGDLVSSWLNPTSIAIGALGVATAAYLAAVYLAADARRMRSHELVQAFRLRALGSGIAAGGLAIGALFVVRDDAHEIWHGLTHGAGVVALIASVAAGVTTLVLVGRGTYELSRVTAAVAVAAIIAGWAIAQHPRLLPGLTVEQAAAPHATLVALLVSLAAGAVVLVPSLAVLFALVLRGRFDPSRRRSPAFRSVRRVTTDPRRLLGPVAVACMIAGFVLVVLGDATWVRALGTSILLVFIASTFSLIATDAEARDKRS